MYSSIAKRWAHVAIATLAAGLIVNHAWAAPDDNQVARSIVVRYSDLDLSRPKDAHTLYYRLHAAARWVCSNIGVREDNLASISEYNRCMRDALTNAVASVGSERLTEIHVHTRYNR